MAVRVVVAYTSRHPAVEEALPDHTEWFDVSADSDAYWRVLRDVWADGETFTVVEHDVIVGDLTLEMVERCDEPWCTYPYDNICHWECMQAWANALGCTRFTAELIAAAPRAVETIPEEQRDWHNLCDSIAGNKVGGVDRPTLRPDSVRAAGFVPHWHFPPVRHDHGDPTITVDWQTIGEQGWKATSSRI